MSNATRRFSLVLACGLLCSALLTVTAAQAVEYEFHGFMLNRLYVSPGQAPFFQVDRVSLQTVAKISPRCTGVVEIYHHPWVATQPSSTYVESAYVDLKDADGKGFLRVGRGRRLGFGIVPTYGNRKTSNYGLVSETFTQDRVQGIQYCRSEKQTNYAVSLYTAYTIGARTLGLAGVGTSTRGVRHLADRDSPSAINPRLELSARVGTSTPQGLAAGLSFATSKLSPADLTYMNTNLDLDANPATNHWSSRTRTRYGLDAQYVKGPWVGQLEYYVGKTSSLDHNAWCVLAGHTFPAGQKAFVRYAAANNDVTPVAGSQLTWDTTQWMFSAVQPIKWAGGPVWIQCEYERNDESPPAGTAKVANDVFFAELFVGF